ncbi:hypothetical protein [Microbacterium sp.]|uniref:hypothetical protein n=1 Tax=Microbacterium sp. TaxID=51671 RepID=UPI003A956A6F
MDFADLDFSEGMPEAVLDLGSKLALEGGLAGNVSGHFEAGRTLDFLTLEIVRKAAAAKAASA